MDIRNISKNASFFGFKEENVNTKKLRLIYDETYTLSNVFVDLSNFYRKLETTLIAFECCFF